MKAIFFISQFVLYTCICSAQKDSVKPIVFDAIDTSKNLKHLDSLELNQCNCGNLTNNGINNEVYLYNKDKKIVKCGYFINDRLIFGFHYIYSDDDDVIRMEKIFNGKKIGECDIPVKE